MAALTPARGTVLSLVRRPCSSSWRNGPSSSSQSIPLRIPCGSRQVCTTSRRPTEGQCSRVQCIPRRRSSTTASTTTWLTPGEERQAKLLETASVKMQIYQDLLCKVTRSSKYFWLMNQDIESMDTNERKEQSKSLKELSPLAEAWDSYQSLRKVRPSTGLHSLTLGCSRHVRPPE